MGRTALIRILSCDSVIFRFDRPFFWPAAGLNTETSIRHDRTGHSKRLKKLGNKEHAAVSQRFFKTGPGEYGAGDVFISIRAPVLRKLAKEYSDLPVEEIAILLRSPIHEERLLALFLLVGSFSKGNFISEVFEIIISHRG